MKLSKVTAIARCLFAFFNHCKCLFILEPRVNEFFINSNHVIFRLTFKNTLFLLFTTHLANYPSTTSKTYWTQLEKQRRVDKWRSSVNSYAWTYQFSTRYRHWVSSREIIQSDGSVGTDSVRIIRARTVGTHCWYIYIYRSTCLVLFFIFVDLVVFPFFFSFSRRLLSVA